MTGQVQLSGVTEKSMRRVRLRTWNRWTRDCSFGRARKSGEKAAKKRRKSGEKAFVSSRFNYTPSIVMTFVYN
jgi:hypothetical protein